MKKTLSLVLSTLLLISLFSVSTISAFAKTLTDGTYKAPLSLVKVDSDEQSLASNFFEKYCYIEVNGSEKTLYIPLADNSQAVENAPISDTSEIELFYYTEGTVDKENGAVETATKLTNVTVGNESHNYAFKMPMVIENNLGLKFKAPGMPSFVNPSAVAKISLNDATPVEKVEGTVFVKEDESTNEKEEQPTQPVYTVEEYRENNKKIITGVAISSAIIIAIAIIATIIEKKRF